MDRSGAPFAARRVPLDRERLAPSDALDIRGMRAGDTSLDHGSFRAATTVVPADLTDSELMTVPPDDRVVPAPLPMQSADHVYRSTVDSTGAPVELRADVLMPDVVESPTTSRSSAASGTGYPVVVFVPGGGFVQSPRGAALLRRAAVAAAGFVVISIEYRTVRHGTAFDGVADVAGAVDWARTHASEFDGDADRVALWGESAGGYLAALAVTTRAVEGVLGVVDTFGLTDLSQVAADFDEAERARHRTPAITEAQYVFGRGSGLAIEDDLAAVQRANPVAQVTGDEPPFLLLHGELDGLVSPGQTQLLHQALLGKEVDSTRCVVAGAGHYGPEWSSGTVIDLVVGHLRRWLGPPRSGRSGGTPRS